MFDEGGGPSGHSTDKGSRPTCQTLIWEAEKVGYAVTDAPHQAGRTAQDLQRPHNPAWERHSVQHGYICVEQHYSTASYVWRSELKQDIYPYSHGSSSLHCILRSPKNSTSSRLWNILANSHKPPSCRKAWTESKRLNKLNFNCVIFGVSLLRMNIFYIFMYDTIKRSFVFNRY